MQKLEAQQVFPPITLPDEKHGPVPILTKVSPANKRPTKEQLKFVETNKDRVGMPRMKQTLDNGFDALSADEYIAVRTKPALEELKERWGYSNECL